MAGTRVRHPCGCWEGAGANLHEAPSALWKGQRSKLAHDPCDVLLWGAHGPFLMAAGLDRNKHGSLSLSRRAAVTMLSVVDQAEL